MKWNYRIVQRFCDFDEEYKFGIHEVYYDENNEPIACTEYPVSIEAENVLFIKTALNKCFRNPILNYEYFEDKCQN